MPRLRPAYLIADVAILVAQRKIKKSKTVICLLSNHGYDVDETVIETLRLIGSDDATFHKSDELHVKPGVFADIYFVYYLGERWYVKFFIVDNVIVMSCKPDGAGW